MPILCLPACHTPLPHHTDPVGFPLPPYPTTCLTCLCHTLPHLVPPCYCFITFGTPLPVPSLACLAAFPPPQLFPLPPPQFPSHLQPPSWLDSSHWDSFDWTSLFDSHLLIGDRLQLVWAGLPPLPCPSLPGLQFCPPVCHPHTTVLTCSYLQLEMEGDRWVDRIGFTLPPPLPVPLCQLLYSLFPFPHHMPTTPTTDTP